jgi:FtsP/CotA-like multicopper oxidase with cupredoxin domain
MPPAALPTAWGSPVALEPPPAAPVRDLVLSEDEPPGMEPIFTINGQKFPPHMMGRSGDVEIWRVQNDAEMDHPFHLHGMFFRVLDIDGAPPAHSGWKDTVNVPQKKAVRIAVRYGTPGMWMFHCHILEHAERGMMSELMLEP